MRPPFDAIHPPQPREEAVRAAVQAATLAFHRREDALPLSRLEFLRQQSHFLRKRWWALQAAVLLVLWWALQAAGTTVEAQRAMGTLAPLFVILVLPELWKNRSSGALEVECAALYSLRQVYAARLVLFGLADLALLTGFFSAALLTGGAAWGELIVHFLLPGLVTGCICLRTLSCRRAGAVYAALPLSLVWTAVWVCIVLSDQVYARVTLPVWLGLLCLAAAYFCYALGKVRANCETLWEVPT